MGPIGRVFRITKIEPPTKPSEPCYATVAVDQSGNTNATNTIVWSGSGNGGGGGAYNFSHIVSNGIFWPDSGVQTPIRPSLDDEIVQQLIDDYDRDTR